ncbi:MULTISPECIES: acyltransferase family protein [Methylobacterium]|uniref:acyltransferase family protein n=1 Tax=Methylobacterium TaxID=407 RepID=UPI0013ED7B9C|nr:acyltransferase family protein [Methylobacterium sp. DB0501]NGM35530.1 acyltransferase [Methylobacterium sp. DB0501]
MQVGTDRQPVHSSYRPDIDGLRAVAVLAVILYHVGLDGMPGGFIGVDVFFVISGYVITRGLLREADRGGIDLAAFYARRIRRILPALLATLAVTSLAAYWLLLPPQFEDYAASAAASALSVANLYFWRSSGYFDAAALYRPLLHTWSLSVEEQFYLLLPVSLLLALRLRLRPLWLPVAAVALASFGLSLYAGRFAPTANFYLLPTRAWELLTGTLLAMAPRGAAGALPLVLRQAGGLAGLGCIAVPALLYSEATPFPGAGAVPPCLGAALLIGLGEARERDVATRLLAAGPLVVIGLISYSAYLVHWPLIVLGRIALMRDFDGAETVAVIAATLVLAALSTRFVERPFRRPSPGAPLRPVLAAGLLATLATAGLGWAGAASGGLPGRFPDFHLRPIPGTETWNHRTCFLFADQTWQAWDQAACTRTGGKDGLILLWGDSFAAHYVPGLIRHGDRLPGNLLQYTAAGCRPDLGVTSHVVPHCHAFNENALALIRRLGIRDVVLAARWGAQRDRAVADGLHETVARVTALGARVHVIGQSPEFPLDPAILAYRQRHAPPGEAGRWHPVADRGLNRTLRAALPAPATFIDPGAALCDGGSCPYAHGETLLYGDSGHFSSAGATYAVGRFLETEMFAPGRAAAAVP